MRAKSEKRIVRHVWVVEMLSDYYRSIPPQWNPTVGVGLDREQGRGQLAIWKNKCHDDKFRLTKYCAAHLKRRKK